MIVLKNSVYLKNPKCASTWIKQVLPGKFVTSKNSRLGGQYNLQDHNTVESLKDCHISHASVTNKKKIWTTVRHPISWYISTYYFLLPKIRDKQAFEKRKICPYYNFFYLCRADSLDKYFENVCKYAFRYGTGMWTTMMDMYVRYCDDFVGIEELPDALIKLMNKYKEPISPGKLKTHPVKQVGPYDHDIKVDQKYVDFILGFENDMCQKLGY